MKVTFTIELTEQQLEELASVYRSNGEIFSTESLKKAAISYIQKEAESIAADIDEYASKIKNSDCYTNYLETIEENCFEAYSAMYQQMLDEADYRSLAYSF